MIQVLEEENSRDFTTKSSCISQSACGLRVVRQIRGYQGKNPAAQHYQYRVGEGNRRYWPGEECHQDKYKAADAFAANPRTVPAGVPKRPPQNARLVERTGDKGAKPGTVGRLAFDVVLTGKPPVVLQVRRAVRVAASQAEQFNQAQEDVRQPAWQSEVTVH